MKWISVKDKLPDTPRQVFVLMEGYVPGIGLYMSEMLGAKKITNNPRWIIGNQWRTVIYWMDIPPLED